MKNKFLERSKRLSRILIPFMLFSVIGVGLAACPRAHCLSGTLVIAGGGDLPESTTGTGIDEGTALVLNVKSGRLNVLGNSYVMLWAPSETESPHQADFLKEGVELDLDELEWQTSLHDLSCTTLRVVIPTTRSVVHLRRTQITT